eukprot:TRINITY_DN2102_c0_g2_i1.p2 TRINITY_DN2102_c0_g2~~TRINITY_DN2102_c0_g2_i1.p2  ORF type:complete len:264 (+),score=24.20 TRINITY_DN2102_c0_g2_i1:45-836(+)
MAGTAALTAAVTLGLLRQWVWEAESWTEVVTVFVVFGLIVFVVILIPASRRLLYALLASGNQHVTAQHSYHVVSKGKRAVIAAGGGAQRCAGTLPVVNAAAPTPNPPDTLPDIAKDGRKVLLEDVGKVFVNMNTAQRGLVWPSQALKNLSGASAWGPWRPCLGCQGTICHYWISNQHPDAAAAHPSRVSFNPTTFVVVRTPSPDDSPTDDGVSPRDGKGDVDSKHKYFIADLEGLTADDGCKEPLVLPRDGDSQGRSKSSGIV